MNPLFFILIGLIVFSFVNVANAQTIINVTSSTPCFLNYTAGYQMWQNCGFGTDPIKAAVAPFEWVTGGLFSMIVVAVLCIMTYVKYHTVIYPIIIGIMFLPTSFFLFPQVFLAFSTIMMAVGIGSIIWFAYHRSTRE